MSIQKVLQSSSPAEMVPNLTVSMSWSCGNVLPQEEVAAPQGYSFTLDDIGCYMSSSPQQFTVRPKPTLAPTGLGVELYGNVADHRNIPLHPMPGGGYEVSYELGGLVVKGALLSHGPQSAQVRLDTVNWNGVDLCDPGTYTLPAED